MITPHLLAPNRFEHMPLAVFASSAEAARAVASEIALAIKTQARPDRPLVLGLATGSTPVGVYAELVRLHREEGLSFRYVRSFNLDEYLGLSPDHPQSYHAFMRAHLFDHIDMAPGAWRVPEGRLGPGEIDAFCQAYEQAITDAGGIDIQLLGIGRTGHIGFNEPGSARRSRTRLVTLDPLTRRDAASDFGGDDKTPRRAITMGVRTILEARRIMIMAWGRHKAEIVREAVEGPVTAQVTASFLQEHDAVQFVVDAPAAANLTRNRLPWLLGPLEDLGLGWDERLTRRAILWLSQLTGKAILKLTDEDYNENGLQDLVRTFGSAYEANLAGFYQMQHTITGWPGGRDPSRAKPGDAPVRPLKGADAGVFPKRILVLSPHPDDDVISMGGTLCRLVDQGHEVHVAYQVSGANAVADEHLWRQLMLLRDSGLAAAGAETDLARLCAEFERQGEFAPGDSIRRWKGLVRRHEAMAAARTCGLPLNRLHFLDLPFYNAPSPRLRRLTPSDVDLQVALLRDLSPHLIFAAGDLDDPHGTHRLCLQVLQQALSGCVDEPWLGASETWLYRGAWAAWNPDEIDLAVPLSPQEVLRRRGAILKHQSQKDQALFLGADQREFWQRAESRGQELARHYNALGLAEYEAIEAFKRFLPHEYPHLCPR